MTLVHLQAVLELDPFEYRDSQRKSPSRSLEQDPSAWEAFFVAALADAGIQGLDPIPGTWVVPVASVQSQELLAQIVAVHWGEVDTAAFLSNLPGPFDPKSGFNAEGESVEEFFEPLRGGFALRVDGEPRIVPQCCGDLSNWQNWLAAAQVTSESWQDFWIGHPSARVACVDGDLLVQGVDEDDELVGQPVATDAAEIQAAVPHAKQELVGLQARLREVVSGGVDPQIAERLATKLAGLAEFALD